MTTVVFDGRYLVCDTMMNRSAGSTSALAPIQGRESKHFCSKCGEEHGRIHQHVHKSHTHFSSEVKFKGEKVVAMAGSGQANSVAAGMVAVKNARALDGLDALRIAAKAIHNDRGNARSSNLCGWLVVTEKEYGDLNCHWVEMDEGDIIEHRIDKWPVVIGSGMLVAKTWLALDPEATALEMLCVAMEIDPSTGGMCKVIDCLEPIPKNRSQLIDRPVALKQLKKNLRKGYIKKSRAIEVPRIALPTFEENKDGQDKRSDTKED